MKTRALSLTLLAFLALLAAASGQAAEYSKHCDVFQGYNFKKDVQTPVGYITELTVGGTALKADQAVKDPENPDRALPNVVGVLSGHNWGLGVTDAMYFSGQVSVYNKQQILQLVYRSLTDVDVSFRYVVYDYDPASRKYFKGSTSTATLKGRLEKNGSDLNIGVADDASTEVQSPQNYSMYIGVEPANVAQQVTIATGPGRKVVKAWGSMQASNASPDKSARKISSEKKHRPAIAPASAR